jgi:hypothetical protein
MDRESPRIDCAASPMARWAAAVAVTAAIAVYLSLHGRAITAAIADALEALRG